MRGVDDEVDEDLVELAQMTGNVRQLAQIELHVGHVLGLVADDLRGAGDGAVQVSRLLLLAVRVRELLHRPDDGGDPLHAVERTDDGLRHVLAQVGKVHCLLLFLDARPQHGSRCGVCRGAPQLRVFIEQGQHVGAGLLHEGDAVLGELDGRVDLVRDARGEPPHGLQLLRLPQLQLHLLELLQAALEVRVRLRQEELVFAQQRVGGAELVVGQLGAALEQGAVGVARFVGAADGEQQVGKLGRSRSSEGCMFAQLPREQFVHGLRSRRRW